MKLREIAQNLKRELQRKNARISYFTCCQNKRDMTWKRKVKHRQPRAHLQRSTAWHGSRDMHWRAWTLSLTASAQCHRKAGFATCAFCKHQILWHEDFVFVYYEESWNTKCHMLWHEDVGFLFYEESLPLRKRQQNKEGSFGWWLKSCTACHVTHASIFDASPCSPHNFKLNLLSAAVALGYSKTIARTSYLCICWSSSGLEMHFIVAAPSFSHQIHQNCNLSSLIS